MKSTPLFLVGTRFQAVMSWAVVQRLRLTGYDLIIYTSEHNSPWENDRAFATLICGARKVLYIDRAEPKLRFVRTLNHAFGPGPRLVLTAWINDPFVLSLFRFRPGLRLQTFDEGGYNIAPNGPFFSPVPKRLRSLRDLQVRVLVRVLFPNGPLAFSFAQSECHFTAFKPSQNFMADRAVQVHIPWEDFAEPEELVQFEGTRSIMVLPCFKDFRGSACVRDRIVSKARKCDLVVRHPRDAILPDLTSVRLSSPIEAIACALAVQKPITLMHYGSTVGQTLQSRANIDLIDLSDAASNGLEL
jgi:hypothetical protein